MIVIRTAKDPKVDQIKVGEKGEILIPQTTAASPGPPSPGQQPAAAASPGPVGAGAGALKGAEASDDAKGDEDSKKKEDPGIKSASGSSGSADSKTSDLSSGSTGNNSGLLGGGVPSGFSSVPDTTGFTDTPVIPATTTSDTSTTDNSTSSTSTTLLQILESIVSDDGIPGAVMAVQTPTETWIGAAGKADLGDTTLGRDPQAMTADTQVHLAGVTRLFTAALIMKLVEENKIKLDDTVESLLGLLCPGPCPPAIRSPWACS